LNKLTETLPPLVIQIIVLTPFKHQENYCHRDRCSVQTFSIRPGAAWSSVERVGSRAPPGEEQAESHSLHDLGNSADGDGVDGTSLGEELGEEGGSRRGGEDETTEVRGALVAESTSSVDESTNTVGLKRGSNQRGTPGDGSRGGLLGLEELLLGVGELGALVGLAEDGGQDCECLLAGCA
jgi:hypothetical protein